MLQHVSLTQGYTYFNKFCFLISFLLNTAKIHKTNLQGFLLFAVIQSISKPAVHSTPALHSRKESQFHSLVPSTALQGCYHNEFLALDTQAEVSYVDFSKGKEWNTSGKNNYITNNTKAVDCSQYSHVCYWSSVSLFPSNNDFYFSRRLVQICTN